MLLWFGLAVLTAVVVAALLRPLLADGASAGLSTEALGPAASTAVYRDQLAEIAAERARGLIAESEAEAARVEIARRLLAAADGSAIGSRDTAPPSAYRDVRTLAMGLAAGLPVLAVVVYLALGAPGQPGQPFAARTPDGPGTNVEQLVARVEERLRTHPEDGRGWDVIAPVYLRLGRYHEAANAFQQALRLVGRKYGPARRPRRSAHARQ